MVSPISNLKVWFDGISLLTCYEQVVIDQLKSQLLELDTARSELDALKIRESTLEKEVHELLLELKDARETHTPVSDLLD